MSEIDDVLAESMRRRAAEARLGGGSMADVQQRVVRRRRRVATVACAVLVLPAFVGVGVVIGQHSSRTNISAAAKSDTPTAVASSSAPCAASFPAGVTPTPCAMSNGLVVSCTGAGTVSVGAPDAAPPDPVPASTTPPDPAPAGTVPAGAVPASTTPPDSAPVVTPDTGPTNTYAVIDPSQVNCSMPACVSDVMVTSTQSIAVGAGGSSTAAAGATNDATTVPPAVIFALPAEPAMIVPGSVPPDDSTKGVVVDVAGPANCGGPTSWTCTGEITTSSTQPGWRDFTQCVPVFRTVDRMTTVESGTVQAGTVVAGTVPAGGSGGAYPGPPTTVVLDPSTGAVVTTTP